MIFNDVYPHLRGPLYGIMVWGATFFLIAGHTIARQQSPQRLVRPVYLVTHYFSISVGQLVLLTLAPAFALLTRLAAGDQLLAQNAPVMTTAWLLTLGCLIGGTAKRHPEHHVTVSRLETLFIVGLFIAAFLLRGVALEQYPNTLSGDEGSAGLTAVGFVSGESNNLFTLGWFSFPSFYFAVQSLGIRLLGQTTEGLRITSSLAGALTVVAVYWLGRVMFNRKLAVLAAAYLLTFHYHIHFSRIGLNNIWDGFFFVVVIAGLWQGWQTGWRIPFVISGVALGMAQYFYVTTRVLPLLLLIWTAFAFWKQRETFKARFPDLVLTAFIAFIIFLPLLLFFQQHPLEFNAPLQRVTIYNGWLEGEVARLGSSETAVILDQIKNTALGITHLPLRHWYNPGTPLLLSGAAALFLLGLLWSLKSFDLRHLLLLLPLLALIILGGFSQDAPASQRFVIAAPIVAVFVVIPLGQIIEWLQTFWPEYKRYVWLAAAATMAWLMWADVHYYFGEVYDTYVLGGVNTEVATRVAHYLMEKENPGEPVYFFGLPRMGYLSLSTIPYLAPHKQGVDVDTPLQGTPVWISGDDIIFIFLPERLGELEYVKQRFSEGRYIEFYGENGTLLAAAYEVSSSS